jgi:hypothetical protein
VISGEALNYFSRKRCDVSKNNPKNEDHTTRKIDKELDQQVEPKEMSESTDRKPESKSPRRER